MVMFGTVYSVGYFYVINILIFYSSLFSSADTCRLVSFRLLTDEEVSMVALLDSPKEACLAEQSLLYKAGITKLIHRYSFASSNIHPINYQW